MAKDMEKSTYRYIQDPGHGWVVVSLAEVTRLGIAGDITSCSYIKDGQLYLEEDQDAQTWSDAKRKTGEVFSLVDEVVEYTDIREYPAYTEGVRC